MEKTTKVTEREMFAIIKEGMADNADVVAFCDKKLASLDRKNEAAKRFAARRREAADELRTAILTVLSDEPKTLKTIVADLGMENLTTNKIAPRLVALVNEGTAVRTKIAGETAAHKVVAYSLASID